MKIKGVIFDCGGVLTMPQDEECLAELEQLLGINDRTLLLDCYRSFRIDYDLGLSGKDYWAKVFKKLNLNFKSDLTAQLVELDIRSWTRINLEMLKLVEHLRAAGLKVYILSNMPVEFLEFVKNKFEWLNIFEECFFSCELGLAKPHRDIYQHFMDRTRLIPGECIFIDDSADNVRAASEFGIKAVLFQGIDQLKNELKKYLL